MPRPAQPDLFPDADAQPRAQPYQGLTISAHADAALSPEQRKYNQLVAKVEKAREDLACWEEEGPRMEQEHRRLMHPLQVELAAKRHALVLKLADLLAGSRLGRKDKDTMTQTLCNEAGMLASCDFLDKEAIAQMEALYDRYADQSLAEERREALDEMKSMIQAVSGVDMGDTEFESEEELLLHAQQKVQAAAQAGYDMPPPPFGSPWGPNPNPIPNPPPRQSAAQRKRHEQQEKKRAEEEAQASQSVREVFRKLASALHPDRADDEADRLRRTALMQRVNQAYERQDLLTLFSLQLEIEQIDPEHLARASTDRVRHYIRVLSSQLADLQNEIRQREMGFRMALDLDDWDRLNPRKLRRFLDENLKGIRAAISEVARNIKQVDTLTGLKQFLQRERVQHLIFGDSADIPF